MSTQDPARARGRDDANDRRLRTIIDRIADGVVIVGGDGGVRFVNPAAEELFGRPSAELVGSEFGFPVVAGETTEIDIVRRAAKPVTAELRVVEVDWEGERALLASLRDVTDRKHAEQKARELARAEAKRAEAEASARKIARLYEKAQAASRAKSNFLGMMSHELRTPLNAIIGYTDLLAAEIPGALTEQQSEYVARIKRSSAHLLQLVDEVLVFTRLEANRERVEYARVDVVEVLDEVVAIVEPMITHKRLRFVRSDADAPASVETDPARLRQILLNLLSNAIKFTDEGEIELRAHADGRWLMLAVRDTGVGIPASAFDRIWEPFWQVEQTATRTREGSGLGLSVARRLARLLGGDIEVESTLGVGTEFTVRLPLEAQAAKPRVARRDAETQ